MQFLKTDRQLSIVFLIGIALILFLLWLPNTRYPITQDGVGYAHLSKSIWEHGKLSILNEPDDVFVPMQPIISYLFIGPFGINNGMKIATLVYGILFFVMAFIFFRMLTPDRKWTPYITVGLMALTCFVTWLLSTGNADLLYACLFFTCLTLYLKTKDNPKLYPLLGILIGITMLTRYMGIALLAIVAVDTLVNRRSEIFRKSFLSIFPLALAIFSLWFIRHKLTFGTWFGTFHVGYTLSDQIPLWQRVFENILFYINPIHSIFLLLPFTLLGLWFYARKYFLPAISIPLSILLCYIYPSVTSRFLITTIPFLLFFATLGIQKSREFLHAWIVGLYLTLAILVQVGLTCMYTSPQCNALIDRLGLPGIPADLDLTQERLESIQESVDWINENAITGATVIASPVQEEDLAIWEDHDRLRDDLTLALTPSCERVTYEINEKEKVSDTVSIVFESRAMPTEVVRVISPDDCKKPLGRDPYHRYW